MTPQTEFADGRHTLVIGGKDFYRTYAPVDKRVPKPCSEELSYGRKNRSAGETMASLRRFFKKERPPMSSLAISKEIGVNDQTASRKLHLLVASGEVNLIRIKVMESKGQLVNCYTATNKLKATA